SLAGGKAVNRTGIVLVALGLLFVACKDNKQEPAATPTPAATTPSTPPPAASTAAAPSAIVAPSGKMAHCPSTVTGAKTDVKDAANGVEITVTSKDETATKEIRARSAFLATSSKNDAQSVGHNGSGEGGGVFGRCPVVMRNTTVAATDVEGGSKLVVVPRDTKEQDWLRREARTRA